MDFADKFDELVRDHAKWSQETFGSDADRGPLGALRHLEKEAREAQDRFDEPEEYADCFLLILDASRRAGIKPMQLVEAAQRKMEINKSRKWPTPTDDMPVEHVREQPDEQVDPRSGLPFTLEEMQSRIAELERQLEEYRKSFESEGMDMHPGYVQSWTHWKEKADELERQLAEATRRGVELCKENGRILAENEDLRIGRLRICDMSVHDHERLVAWMRDPNRKPADVAFTAGAARSAATAFEEASKPQ